MRKAQDIINEAIENGRRRREEELAGVIAEVKSKAEQEAAELIAAAKQTAKQIIFQAFQRSLGTILDKNQVTQEKDNGN